MKVLVVALLLAGCTSETDEPPARALCISRQIGNANAPMALRISGRAVGPSVIELTVHATNVDGCAVAVSARATNGHRSDALAELDARGEMLVTVDLDDVIDVTVQDATGRWASSRWTP